MTSVAPTPTKYVPISAAHIQSVMVIRIPKAAHLRSAAEPQLTSPPARHLTVKLRGRPETPDQAPRAHNLFSTRGADTHAVHGPLQRLLDIRRLPTNPLLRISEVLY